MEKISKDTVNIGYVQAPKENQWRVSGGGAYKQLLLKLLLERYDVETMGMVLGQGNKLLQGAKLLYRLCRLKGVKDIWIRNFLSTVTLPFDRTAGKNVLILHHFDSAYTAYPVLSRFLERVFYHNLRNVDVVVTVSQYWKRHFEAKGHRNVRVIYNPFDIDSFRFTKQEITDFIHRHGLQDKPIVYIGNCQKAKGVVEVYVELKDLDINLVTSGEQRVSIPARNLNLDYRDYLRLLKASSVVVTMSKFNEGWNRTAHEAMLCKTPVIGSGFGGMKELLEGGQQVVCQSFDELERCVEYALEHPEMGEKGYDFAKDFTVERFESEWIKLIEDLRDSS